MTDQQTIDEIRARLKLNFPFISASGCDYSVNEADYIEALADCNWLLTALDEMLANGPAMQRGTNADGAPLMGTMREVMEDYKAAAEAEAKAADEARRENERLRDLWEQLKGYGADLDSERVVIQALKLAEEALAADEPKDGRTA